MKIEIKTRWCEALRSGDYKQGREALHPTPKQFCCLGVLTDLFIKDHDNAKWAKRGVFADHLHLSVGGEECGGGYLDLNVVKWAGLDSRSPRVGSEGNDIALAVHNDEGASFSYIAGLIEKHL